MNMCLFGASGAQDAVAVVILVKRLARADLFDALFTGETLLVVVLVLEHQVGLVGRDRLQTFAALFGLLLGEALDAIGIVLLVAVDALSDEALGAHGAHEAVVVEFAILKRHHSLQYGLGAFAAFARLLQLILVVAVAAQRTAVQLVERLLLELIVALAAHETLGAK